MDSFSINGASTQNSFTLWNSHKAYMRGILIQLPSRLKKDYSKKLDDLFQLIKLLEGKMQTSDKELLAARLALQQQKTQLKKSKIADYNLMNKPSRLMARRVAAAWHKTKIPLLWSPTSQSKLFSPQDIADSFSAFYSGLYDFKEYTRVGIPPLTEIDSFLNSLNLPSLTESQLHNLNLPFTEEELANVIKTLPNGKSLSPDGFPNEYLKCFIWNAFPTFARSSIKQCKRGQSLRKCCKRL